MYTRVLILVIVESDGFSLSSGERGTTLAKNLGFNVGHIHCMFCCDQFECSDKLRAGDLTCSSLLGLSEDQINVRGCAFFGDETGVLYNFSEGLSIHLRSFGVLSKHFLQVACASTRRSGRSCATSLLLALLCDWCFLLFFKMDTGDLMSDSSHICCILDSAHIGIRSIKKTIEASVGINSAGTTLSVNSSV